MGRSSPMRSPNYRHFQSPPAQFALKRLFTKPRERNMQYSITGGRRDQVTRQPRPISDNKGVEELAIEITRGIL